MEESDLNLEDMNSVLFWNEIEDLLTLKVENGDEKASVFLPIFLQIRKLLLQTENNTQPQKILHLSLTYVLPSEQCSESPNPLTQDTRHTSPGAQRGSGHMSSNSWGGGGWGGVAGGRRGRGWTCLSNEACRT